MICAPCYARGVPRKPGPKQFWLLPDSAPPQSGPLAQVALRRRTFRLHDYAIPAALRDQVRPGAVVRVPLRSRGKTADGVVIRVSDKPWEQSQPALLEVVDAGVALPDRLIQLGEWISDYYFCPPGAVFAALLPSYATPAKGRLRVLIRRTSVAAPEDLTGKQRRLLAEAPVEPAPRDRVLQAAGVGVGVLRVLLDRGLIEQSEIRVAAETVIQPTRQTTIEDDHQLTTAQQTALSAINQSDTFRVFLLFGVPGSGKTEVYVRAIRATLARQRQAILLVPEIALATQMVERLARRFDRVALLHSQMTDGQRRSAYQAISAGQADVVIGTRSAVFAPCPRLGLIVVDEEQEGSYKNLAAPFFHARDVAVRRGQIEGATVVLGSATPSLESWSNTSGPNPKYTRLSLPERIPGAAPPRVRVVSVDTRELGQTTTLLSAELVREIRATLSNTGQAILLHNRRGYATSLRCIVCGLSVTCERCGAAMIYHRGQAQLQCGRCGARQDQPARCVDDTCRGELRPVGFAIQRLEDELKREFPAARLLRLDSDTMRRRVDYQDALTAFECGESDILLGTQMVAKGLDFPRVRLVGVIDAEASERLPDFRAAEHTFQLLAQVVGRAGRKDGESLAILQVEHGASPTLQAAQRLDYERFATDEMVVREKLGFPPFWRLARLLLADEDRANVRRECKSLAGSLREIAGRVDVRMKVSDAEPCVIAKLRGRWRWQVLLRAPRGLAISRLLRAALSEKRLSPKTQRFSIDIDPLDMM